MARAFGEENRALGCPHRVGGGLGKQHRTAGGFGQDHLLSWAPLNEDRVGGGLG